MKTLKMKSFKNNLIIIIALFVFGIVGLTLSVPPALMLIQGPQD